MHRNRTIFTAILLSFALVVGHFVWHSAGPAASPDYFVGGTGPALTGSDPHTRHLYLRYKFYLSERPSHAWFQLLTRSHVRLYLNGKLLADRSPDGYMGAILLDPTPLMQVGPNVIAISAEQYSPKRPAMVAFEGCYRLSDGEHRIMADPTWRASNRFERGTDWWFMSAFDDIGWEAAQITHGRFRAQLDMPPRAVKEPPFGQWITADDAGRDAAVLRRSFEIDGHPRQAWLRLTVASMYRLAVNGVVIDIREESLASSAAPLTVARIYDITPYLRAGTNVIAFLLESHAGPPRLLCQLEVEDLRGHRFQIGSDEDWLCAVDAKLHGLASFSTDPSGWQPCRMQSGSLGVMPWDASVSFAAPPMPLPVKMKRVVGQAFATSAVFVLGWLCCGAATQLLAIGGAAVSKYSAQGVTYLALIPATVGLGAGWLITNDPRIAKQDVYRIAWIELALASVPMQWLVFGLCRWLGRRPAVAAGHTVRAHCTQRISRVEMRRARSWHDRLTLAVAAVIVLAGFLIRLPGIASRPLGADEVNMYRCVQGFYERGFPSFEVHKDLPPQYISTSEFVYAGGALAELFFDNDRYVIRFPSVCWSTLTIALIYVAGRRMFRPVVGLIATAVYAFSPIAITMADFGRYPAQLQFFTTLTVYCFWRTVRGTGMVNRRFLLWTTLSAMAMFLSWEPSLLVAPGLCMGMMWLRRGRIGRILGDGWIWAAVAAVALTVMLQMTHRNFKQSQRMNYGTGASDVALMPMWRYAQFDIAHFLKAASWSQRDVFPMAGLIGAIMLVVRHAFRSSATYLLLTLVSTSIIVALGLPVDADRYSYFLAPLLILLASAATVAAARSLRKLVGHQAPVAWSWYARALVRTAVLVLLILAVELSDATAEWDGTLQSLNPTAESTKCLGGAAAFLNEHVQTGDVVLGTQPYLLNHQMAMASGGRSRLDHDSTLWLQSRLHLQAVLDDVRPLPLNRRDGTMMVANREALATLFARSQRIWLAVEKGHFNRLNVDEVDAFLRQYMDVVYEDFEAIVLLRDMRHRPAAVRSRDEKTLREALTDFLRKDTGTILTGTAENPRSGAVYPLLKPWEDRDDFGPPGSPR